MKKKIGRLSNQYIMPKQRKIIIKYMVPSILLVIAILLSTQINLNNLMGAYIGCEVQCEDGWKNGEDHACYKELQSGTSVMDAYLVGDANNDATINSEDFELLRDKIINNSQLDEREKVIYDINQDHEINNDDIIEFEDILSSVNTTGNALAKIPVCPLSKEETLTDNMGQTIITTTDYELNGYQCNVITTTKMEKQGQEVCKGISAGGSAPGGVNPNSTSKTNSSGAKNIHGTSTAGGFISNSTKQTNTPSNKSTSPSKKTSIYKKAKSYTPKKGDIVFFSANNGRTFYHVGIVYKVSANRLTVVEGNTDCTGSATRCADGVDDDYYLKHSKVAPKTYNNYKKNNYIAGYINMAQIVSRSKAKKMADLAYKQKGKKGNKYWKNTNVWDGYAADWCSIFVAWNLEQKKVKPKKQVGWSASCTQWVNKAKKIKK